MTVNIYINIMKSLIIKFNSKETVACACTYLTNKAAPYRNSSIITSNEDENTYSVSFFTQYWANRAEKELQAYFNTPNKSTHTEPYTLTRD